MLPQDQETGTARKKFQHVPRWDLCFFGYPRAGGALEEDAAHSVSHTAKITSQWAFAIHPKDCRLAVKMGPGVFTAVVEVWGHILGSGSEDGHVELQ